MIAPAYITEWSQQCPWISPAQVEQDLVLSRGLVEIYSDPILRERLLFRGGTAAAQIFFCKSNQGIKLRELSMFLFHPVC